MKPDASGSVRIVSEINQLIEKGKLDMKGCSHFSEIQDVIPSSEGCGSCLEMGDSWVNLRLCMICGHVGCCDASKNTHATKHFHETMHEVIVSFQPGEDWLWCYKDEVSITP